MLLLLLLFDYPQYYLCIYLSTSKHIHIHIPTISYYYLLFEGKDTNSSQFFMCFAPAPWLDNRHVVFGNLIFGAETLKKIELQGSRSGQVQFDNVYIHTYIHTYNHAYIPEYNGFAPIQLVIHKNIYIHTYIHTVQESYLRNTTYIHTYIHTYLIQP